MRILMLSWEYPPHVVGGLGAHVAALVPCLVRRGIEVALITPQWGGGEAESRVDGNGRVIRVPPPATVGDHYVDAEATNARMVETAERLWSDAGQGFDLIHAHDWLVAFAANALKRSHKTPLIATIHATERGRGLGALTDDVARRIDSAEWTLAYEAWRVITASQYMASEVARYFRLPPDKVDVVPNGIDPSHLELIDGTDLTDFRASWALPDEKIIFFVGRLQAEKGVQQLIEATPRVTREFPKAKIIMAGAGSLLEELKKRSSELGVAQRVVFAGFISDQVKDELFKVADVAVFPSLYEPFGIVALEAMAAKLPVVVSDAGGLGEVVRNEYTGRVVKAGDVNSLAAGLLETLRQPDLAAQRAIVAYDLVRTQYNWDRIAARTIEIYERVLAERAGAVWV